MKSVLTVFLSLLLTGALRGQCEPILTCPGPGQQFSDLTVNDANLWNASDWHDPALGISDLGEGSVQLQLQAFDFCGTGLVGRVELLLDLDANGSVETVLDSDSFSTYPAGKLPFGNYNNPAYDGALRAFDQRPVSTGDKYRFGLEHTAQGDNHLFRVVWTTDNAPTVYVDPQLPVLNGAQHTVRWTIHDDNDDYSFCNYQFSVNDAKKPTIVCLNGLSVNIMPTQLITLWATDFLQYTEDNLTPTSQVKIGIRKSGAGTGFPYDAFGNPQASVTFTCAELGTQFIELWAIDAAGNADYCETYVLVQDNMGSCNFSPNTGQLCIELCGGNAPNGGLEDVEFLLEGTASGVPPLSLFGLWNPVPSNPNCYEIPVPVPVPLSYTVRPIKDDNHLNGISTYDLVLIQRHILNQELFINPCQTIAADVNRSNSVTSFDIVEIRKLILGIYSEFPNNTSWRFFLNGSTPPDPLNPFVPALVETLPLVDLTTPTLDPPVFSAVKVGDVNGSALPNSVAPPTGPNLALTVEENCFQAGQTLTVPVTVAEVALLFGFQFELDYTPALQLVNIIPGAYPGMSAECFAPFVQSHQAKVSWSAGLAVAFEPGDVLFTLVFTASEAGCLSGLLSVTDNSIEPEAYSGILEQRPLQLLVATSSVQTPGLAAFGKLFPNPAPLGTTLILPVQVAEPVSLRCELLDLTGRVLYASQRELPGGTSALQLPTSQLTAAGLYTYRLSLGAQHYVGRFMLR